MKKPLLILLTIFFCQITIAQSTEVSIPGSQTKTFTSIKLSSNILQQYSGTYKLNDGTIVEIKPDAGSFSASLPNNTFNLLAASETDFYITSFFLNIHFVKDDKGDVSGFQLNRYGSSEFAKKIK